MKLVIAIVQGEDAQRTATALGDRGIGSTRFASSGGFLQQGNVTLLIGVEEAQVEETLQIIHANCHERTRLLTPVAPIADPGEFIMSFPIEVQVGGATVFVVPIDKFEKI